MASILKVADAGRAQVRRRGHKSVSETFSTKAQAVAWARKIEAERDARRFNDARGLANITLKDLIDWYLEEIGNAHPFGKKRLRCYGCCQLKSKPVILTRKKVTSPTARSDSRKTAATLPAARSTARVSIAFPFFPCS
jgi:hypothetical protein